MKVLLPDGNELELGVTIKNSSVVTIQAFRDQSPVGEVRFLP